MKKIFLLLFLSSVASAEMVVNGSRNITNYLKVSSETVSGILYVSTLTYTGIGNSTSPLKTANYTIAFGDSVILASAPANTNTLQITLPSAAASVNRIYQVTRVDISTRTVQVLAAGSDLISATTGAMYLYAPGQTITLQSDGVSNWWPAGRMPVTPAWMGNEAITNAALAVTANTAYCNSFSVPDFVYLTTITWENGAAGGNYDIGLYDNSGKRIYSLGSTATPAAAMQYVNVTASNLVLAPGIYWDCIGSDNAATTLGRNGTVPYIGSCSFAASFPLPASLTFPTCTAPLAFGVAGVGIGVNGGVGK